MIADPFGGADRKLASRSRSRREERGDTLIELLMALVIVGLAGVALLTAFSTSISASAVQRSLASNDTVARSVADAIFTQIEQVSSSGSSATSNYASCSTYSQYASAGGFQVANVPTGPTGYSWTLAVQYWNVQSGSFTSTCTSGSTAPQQITITITPPHGINDTIAIVVTDPLYQAPPTSGGTPSQLNFVVEPGGAAPGAALTTQPVVAVQNASGGTVTNDSSTVALSIAPNTGTAGAVLSGCSQTEQSGTITFSGCSISLAGTGYVLVATDATDNLSATSAPFDVATAPSSNVLAFTTQPGTKNNRSTLNVQPVVTVQNASGGTVTNDSSTVSLSLLSSNGTPVTNGAVLTCSPSSNSVQAASGVATFSSCSVSVAGTYVLRATDGALAPVMSSTFTITLSNGKG